MRAIILLAALALVATLAHPATADVPATAVLVGPGLEVETQEPGVEERCVGTLTVEIHKSPWGGGLADPRVLDGHDVRHELTSTGSCGAIGWWTGVAGSAEDGFSADAADESSCFVRTLRVAPLTGDRASFEWRDVNRCAIEHRVRTLSGTLDVVRAT